MGIIWRHVGWGGRFHTKWPAKVCKIHWHIRRGLTSTPHNLQEEVALPTRPTYQSHQEEIWLHAAAQEFWKMWRPKISKLKGGYTSSAGLVFQSWLKDICVHVQDRRLTQRQAIQLVKDFTAEHAQDDVEFYMGMVAEGDQSSKVSYNTCVMPSSQEKC